MNFEEMIKKLEEISKLLESGNLTLDESVKKFEEGMEVSKQCYKILDEAEKKIKILIKDNDGNIEEEDFNLE